MTDIKHETRLTTSPHTPEPWEFHLADDADLIRAAQANNGAGCDLPLYHIISDDCRNIATVRSIYNGRRVEAVELANARLIAAAPRLLNALDRLLKAYSEQPTRIMVGDMTDALMEACEVAAVAAGRKP